MSTPAAKRGFNLVHEVVSVDVRCVDGCTGWVPGLSIPVRQSSGHEMRSRARTSCIYRSQEQIGQMVEEVTSHRKDQVRYVTVVYNRLPWEAAKRSTK